jgi:hypothetical protein
MFYLKLVVLAFFGYAAIAVPNDSISVEVKIKPQPKKSKNAEAERPKVSESSFWRNSDPIIHKYDFLPSREAFGKIYLATNDWMQYTKSEKPTFATIIFWSEDGETGKVFCKNVEVTREKPTTILFSQFGDYRLEFRQGNILVSYRFKFLSNGEFTAIENLKATVTNEK